MIHIMANVLSKYHLNLIISAFFICLTTSAADLPEKYKVIPQEMLGNFYFLQDQPWKKEPERVKLNDIAGKGRVTILHFWASTCPKCVPELDEIEQVIREYAGREIDFFAISLNDSKKGVLHNYFMSQKYLGLKPYHRPGITKPNIRGVPTTFFLNKSGKLIGRIDGVANWQSDEMRRLLERLIVQEFEEEEGSWKWVEKLKNLVLH